MQRCEAKRISNCSRETKNAKKLSFDQQLQLMTKQIDTKNGQYCFS